MHVNQWVQSCSQHWTCLCHCISPFEFSCPHLFPSALFLDLLHPFLLLPAILLPLSPLFTTFSSLLCYLLRTYFHLTQENVLRYSLLLISWHTPNWSMVGKPSFTAFWEKIDDDITTKPQRSRGSCTLAANNFWYPMEFSKKIQPQSCTQYSKYGHTRISYRNNCTLYRLYIESSDIWAPTQFEHT